MFERYTEKARRIIFFARYEASQFGSPFIETEHLLLGVLRENKALALQFLPSHAAVESIRKQIEAHSTIREKVSTSVDLPLSHECKRVLAYGAEEAERLNHKYITPEHLLLGLLREEQSFAAKLLKEQGLQSATVREMIAQTKADAPLAHGHPLKRPTIPEPLVTSLLHWKEYAALTIALRPTVNGLNPDLAIYEGDSVDHDGIDLGTGDAEANPSVKQRLRQIVQKMEDAVAHHEFEKARFYSDEERKLRQELKDLKSELAANQPVPFLCILLAGSMGFPQILVSCDAFLNAGVEQVWVLDSGTNRAFTVTKEEGVREAINKILKVRSLELAL